MVTDGNRLYCVVVAVALLHGLENQAYPLSVLLLVGRISVCVPAGRNECERR